MRAVSWKCCTPPAVRSRRRSWIRNSLPMSHLSIPTSAQSQSKKTNAMTQCQNPETQVYGGRRGRGYPVSHRAGIKYGQPAFWRACIATGRNLPRCATGRWHHQAHADHQDRPMQHAARNTYTYRVLAEGWELARCGSESFRQCAQPLTPSEPPGWVAATRLQHVPG